VAERFDAIVLGLGGMGSASTFHLARRGLRVLGLERFDVLHPYGSSHGVNRIIRLAYSEHPSYVPLLLRAYELWHELENLHGRQLLYTTGSLEGGLPEGDVFAGAKHAAELHHLSHDVLTGEEISRRWPAFRLPSDHRLVYQPDGGFLASEECILAHVRQGLTAGAELHWREQVLEWGPLQDGVWVRTDRERYEGKRLVVCAGSWLGKLFPDMAARAVPERQVLAWLQPTRPERFALGAFPVFNTQVDEGHYYGFPEWGIPGFKFGRYHHLEEQGDPDALDREPSQRDEQVLRAFAERYFPDGAGPTSSLKVCLFENTPDEHFLLGLHPEHENVVVAGGGSGHAFKFASVIGELVAQLVAGDSPRLDISLLSPERFAGRSG
jgi:sarcosine oxidase